MDVVDAKEERKLGERMVDMTFEQSRHGCTDCGGACGEGGDVHVAWDVTLSFAYRLPIQANVQSIERACIRRLWAAQPTSFVVLSIE